MNTSFVVLDFIDLMHKYKYLYIYKSHFKAVLCSVQCTGHIQANQHAN